MHRFVRQSTRVFLALALSLSLGCQNNSEATATLQPPSLEAIQKSVGYLASDELEGRGLGTQGLDTAAEYIAGYFRALGLEPPPGQSDYFQSFTHSRVTGLDPATVLTVNGKSLEQSEQFQPHSLSAEGSFEGPIVFAGYGVSKPEGDDQSGAYDDFADIDVKGKVVLALRFEPHKPDGWSRLVRNTRTSDHASLPRKAKLAAERGAVAMLVVHPPNHQGEESFSPAVRQGGEKMALPVVQIKQAVANELLATAGVKDLKTLQAEIDESFTPRSAALRDSAAKGNATFKRTTYTLRNITACLPGARGSRSKEYIVVGAHYDHLGRGGVGSLTPSVKDIHNGADDNASGTAAVLELARIFSQADPRPDRSLLFCAFSGEEIGLLGSKHWVDHAPVPLDSVKAMINLDMVGRIKDNTLIVGGAGTAASFQTMIDKVDLASPLQVKGREEWKNGFAPSDNTSFVLKRIPVLFLFTGHHSDYHKPTDDADKINYDGMLKVVELASNVILELSEHTKITFTPPAHGSATHPTTTASPSPHGAGASLGVVPDYGSDDATSGVRISGTTPGSAAEKAGLQSGDILTEFDGKKLSNLYDLTDALGAASPGKTINITATRNGMPITVKATLTERRRMQ